MANLFLTNVSLQTMIEGTRLAADEKNFLLAKLAQLDGDERKELFDFLKEVYFIDRAEVRAAAKVRQSWK